MRYIFPIIVDLHMKKTGPVKTDLFMYSVSYAFTAAIAASRLAQSSTA